MVMPRLTLSAISDHAEPALRLFVAFVPSIETVSGSRFGLSFAVATWIAVTMLGPIAGVTINPVPTPLSALLMLELPLPKLRYFVTPLRSMLLAGASVDWYCPPPVPTDEGVSPRPTDPWKNPLTASPAAVANGNADAFA